MGTHRAGRRALPTSARGRRSAPRTGVPAAHAVVALWVSLVLVVTIPAFAYAGRSDDRASTTAVDALQTSPLFLAPAIRGSASRWHDVNAVHAAVAHRQQVAAANARARARAKVVAARKAAAARVARAARAKARRLKAAQLAALARSWVWPLERISLSARFGVAGPLWESGHHTGQDFSAATGTPVRTVGSGVVVFAGNGGRYGNIVEVRHVGGDETWYAHLSVIGVKVGQQVRTKDVIGEVGSTGNTTGPHLHLEVHPKGGDAVDPLPWLRRHGLRL